MIILLSYLLTIVFAPLAWAATGAPAPPLFDGGTGSGGTYYVSPGGSGTSCTNSLPCQLSQGAAQAQAGEKVILKNGTYSSGLTTVRSGTAGNHIVFQAENQGQAVLSPSSGFRTISVQDNYLTFDGIKIDNNGDGHGIGLTTSGGNHHIIVENMTFFHTGRVSFRVWSTNSSDTDLIVRNNTFDGSGYEPNQLVSSAIYLGESDSKGVTPGPKRVMIYGNDISDWSSNCVDVKAYADDIWIFNNSCHDDISSVAHGITPELARDGTFVISGERTYIYDNFIYGITDNGPIFSVGRSGGNPSLVYNNVIYASSDVSQIIKANSSPNGGNAPQIFNNTFWGLGGYSISESAFSLPSSSSIRNNIGVNRTNNITAPSSSYFTNTAGGDFTLTSLATNAIDKVTGDPFSSVDKDGTPIFNSIRDYGAFEFSITGQPPNTVYVAPNGTGASPCSLADPCSVTDAFAIVPNGGTVLFTDGTYAPWGTQTHSVTYKALNLHQAIISSDGSGASKQAISISHNGTVIDGLRITGGCVNEGDSCGGGSGHGLVRWFATAKTTIRNSIVENSAGELLNICGTHDNDCNTILVEDNILRESGFNASSGEGIYIGQSAGNNTVDGVIIRRNDIQGVGCDQALDVKPGGTNVEVYHNIFEDQLFRSTAGCGDVDGVVTTQGQLDFHHNIVRANDLATSVFRLTELGGLLQDNVVYSNTHTGDFIRNRATGTGSATQITDNVWCSNSNTTITGTYTLSNNTSGTGTPAPDCTAKENEILVLKGDDPVLPAGDITTDLIAHLRFESSLTDETGTTTWTHSGTPSYSTGKIESNALTLDGTEYVTAGTHTISGTRLFPVAGNPFSVAAWVKTSATGTVIASAAGPTVDRDFQMAMGVSGNDLFYMRGIATQLPTLNDGAWHHLVVTWDGTIGKVYRDGDVANANMQIGSSPEDTGEDIIIGARTGGTGFLLTGDIDEVRIYSRELDAAAVGTLFGTTSPDTTAPTAPSNLVATPVGMGQIDLSWTASTDAVGVTLYTIFSCAGVACTGFVEVGTATETTFSHTGLVEELDRRYYVTAQDAAGNISAQSNTAEANSTVATFYIQPALGSDTSGCGTTEGNACATWAFLNSEQTPNSGDTVCFLNPDGTTELNEKLSLTAANSGTSGAPLILDGRCGGQSARGIIDGTGLASGAPAALLSLSGVDWVIVQDLEIRNLHYNDEVGVNVIGGSTNITMNRLKVHDIGSTAGNAGTIGISIGAYGVDGGHTHTIQGSVPSDRWDPDTYDCQIYSNYWNNVKIGRSNEAQGTSVLKNCAMWDATGDVDDSDSVVGGRFSNNWTISDNLISNGAGGEDGLDLGYGDAGGGSCLTTGGAVGGPYIVERNIITDLPAKHGGTNMARMGFLANGCSTDVTFRNNIIKTAARGMEFYDSPSDLKIYHNTVLAGKFAVRFWQHVDGVEMINNVFIGCTQGSCDYERVVSTDTLTSDCCELNNHCKWQNNVIIGDGAAPEAVIMDITGGGLNADGCVTTPDATNETTYNESALATFEGVAWWGTPALDDSSWGTLPSFVDRNGNDFSLQVGDTIAIDKGQSIASVTTDFLGNPRDGTPDIGAFELSGAAPPVVQTTVTGGTISGGILR